MKKIFMLLSSWFFINSVAYANECKVLDPDIAQEYSGGCQNGLAHGKGTAKGRDNYTGDFLNGLPSGKGHYVWGTGEQYNGDWKGGKRTGRGENTWSNGSKYVGLFYESERTNFGTMTLVKNDQAILSYSNQNLGYWAGDSYIAKGLWGSNNLLLECTSLSDCNRREAAIRKSEAYDRAHACDKFYSGKAIRFKPAGLIYFGSELDAVVLGKGNGNISLKIVDRYFHDDYGKILEVSCNSDQLR